MTSYLYLALLEHKLKWDEYFISDINTLLSRETARETQVLNSSGFF